MIKNIFCFYVDTFKKSSFRSAIYPRTMKTIFSCNYADGKVILSKFNKHRFFVVAPKNVRNSSNRKNNCEDHSDKTKCIKNVEKKFERFPKILCLKAVGLILRKLLCREITFIAMRKILKKEFLFFITSYKHFSLLTEKEKKNRSLLNQPNLRRDYQQCIGWASY